MYLPIRLIHDQPVCFLQLLRLKYHVVRYRHLDVFILKNVILARIIPLSLGGISIRFKLAQRTALAF